MDVGGRRTGRLVLSVLGLPVAAFVVWVVGVVGVGQYGEDLCSTDPPSGATGYQSDGTLLPPRLTCVYTTVDGETLRVDHPAYATAVALWRVGFPVISVVAIGAFVIHVLHPPAASDGEAGG